MSDYVGLKKGKIHESHVISEYYCGGCSWPVTDHDSYCPECGGALHEDIGNSRYHELFGTPERAARTLAMNCYGATSDGCETCVNADCDGTLRNKPVLSAVYDELLEWLRDDAE